MLIAYDYGEVCDDPEAPEISKGNYFLWRLMIDRDEQGKGYGKQGLRLLADRAFRVDGISRLHNDFETTRDAAYRIHKDVGFRKVGIEDGILQLELTREEYLASVLSGIGE